LHRTLELVLKRGAADEVEGGPASGALTADRVLVRLSYSKKCRR
jgi:hypothetical protein